MSQPIVDTVTDAQVAWEADGALDSLSGKRVRLRFRLRNAKLYGFQIG